MIPNHSGPAGPPGSDEEDDYLAAIFEAEPEPATRGTSVAWPEDDRASPCYAHLVPDERDAVGAEPAFACGAAEFDLLLAMNRFRPLPAGAEGLVAFGVRGATLRGAEKQELAARLELADARPDHRNFRCVIGWYFQNRKEFSAYTASTVPWYRYMESGAKLNLLPEGAYPYKKGVHRPKDESRWVEPALRLSDAGGAESGPATVLRTRNNLVFEMSDFWDSCAPGDNVHCAYSADRFSSLGCQTIKGGLHDGLWADFQKALNALADNQRVDYVLLTGAEWSIAASLVGRGIGPGNPEAERLLARLRAGSEGEEVARLQALLGIPATGKFDYLTKKKLIDYQRAEGHTPDGIYSPRLDKTLGWSVFQSAAAAGRPDPAPDPGHAQPGPPPAVIPASLPAPATPPSGAPAVPETSPQPAPGPRPGVLLTPDTLREFAPKAKPEYAEILGTEGNAALSRFGINVNALRFCHFMAQVGHECGGFTITHESLKYRAERMVQVFGPGVHSAKLTLSEAKKLVGHEEAFAERVYGLGNPTMARKLGNSQPGDGYRYRGRGFIQITGRDCYREMGRKIGIDLEADPDKAADPLPALLTAAAFWDDRSLNPVADADDLPAITKRINGGHNGLDDRKARYALARRIWGAPAATRGSGGRRVLGFGSLGPEVVELKRRLRDAGYDGFGPDADFDRDTHFAVARFQMDHGLPGDGMVGESTWNLLEGGARSIGSGAPRTGRSVAGSGRAVLAWGIVLLLVAGVLAAIRFAPLPAAVVPGLAIGAMAMTGIAGLSLIGLGIRISRKARIPHDRGTGKDEVIRSEVNLGAED